MYVKVIVTPHVRREQVTKITDTEFHIEVREPRERNMANKRIIELIAREFGVSTTKVRILTGHRSQSKIVDVDV